MSYPIEEQALETTARRPTISEELARKKKRLEEELAQVNEAIKFKEENPVIQQSFDIVGKVVRGY